MLLVYGTAGLALAMLAFGIVLIGSRNPQEPTWAGEALVANVYTPIIVVLAVLGTGSLVKFILSFGSQPLGLTEIALAAVIAAAGIILLKMLRIKKHLAAFDNAEKNGVVIKPAVFFKNDVGSEKPEPPARSTVGGKAA